MCRLVVHLQQVRQRLDRRLAVLRDAEQSQYLVSTITRLHSRVQVAQPPGCLLVHRATVVLAMWHAVLGAEPPRLAGFATGRDHNGRYLRHVGAATSRDVPLKVGKPSVRPGAPVGQAGLERHATSRA